VFKVVSVYICYYLQPLVFAAERATEVDISLLAALLFSYSIYRELTK